MGTFSIYNSMNIISSFPMSKVTSFKCGGLAKWFVCPDDLKDFESILKLHNGKKFYILGNGSNTLCPDDGYDGLVISTSNLKKIKKDGNIVVCECGVNLFALNDFLRENGLGGLEWSYGIPGTVGGATIMNSGAFEKDISEFVEKVEIFDDGKVIVLDKNEISFSYRKSSLKDFPIFRVWLKLFFSEKETIKELQDFYFEKRNSKQPLNYPSAGSIFKRGEDFFPAEIIDKLGLKGYKIGGAQISEKHSGFIINQGEATATDIMKLINLIEDTVFNKKNIKLEREIIIMK
ncbi:MAG: UDP-N-acetylmuramate dehydrogenase [Clostridia bacterium]|nr:UDP-N-acetylmuramate dehydrogenase [Clostridia bacterium]